MHSEGSCDWFYFQWILSKFCTESFCKVICHECLKELSECVLVPSSVYCSVVNRQCTRRSCSKSWITCSRSLGISRADRASWLNLRETRIISKYKRKMDEYLTSTGVVTIINVNENTGAETAARVNLIWSWENMYESMKKIKKTFKQKDTLNLI